MLNKIYNYFCYIKALDYLNLTANLMSALLNSQVIVLNVIGETLDKGLRC